MVKRKAKKVEAWLTQDEWRIVEAHIDQCCADSAASYVRAAVLAGLPVRRLQLDGVINDLALAVNSLSRSLEISSADDVAKLVPIVKTLVRQLQKSQASQSQNRERE